MKVEVTCFGVMRDYLPDEADGNRCVVEIPDGSSIADVVSALGAPARLVTSVLINGTRADLDSEAPSGGEVTLMPAFTGGARPT